MSNRLKTYRLLIIISSAIAVLLFLSYVVLMIVDVASKVPFLPLIYLLVFPLVIMLLMFAIVRYSQMRESIKTLENENLYNLGRKAHCFNYSIFAKAKKKYVSAHHKEGNYIIALSVSKINNIRTSAIRQINSLLSIYMYNIFNQGKKEKDTDNFYCYYHGAFVIYSYCSLYEVKKLMNQISDQIFAIAKEKDINVYVQPFFGVEQIKKETSLMEQVENALVARELSEKRFENVTFYSADLKKDTSLTEINEIKQAILHHEMVVYYQPKYSLKEKKFISSEALVRWNSPKYGLLSPALFIEKAEMGGLIHKIDMMVLENVCKDLASMRKRGDLLLPVSINFSLYEFFDPSFLKEIFDICYKYGVDTKLIEIEITETTTQKNPFIAISILKKLKQKGFRVLMDDFGLGFSNLGNLNRLPLDAVKIDKSFIDGLVNDMKTRDIVKFLISLCKTNNLEVIAEGVDKIEQVNILRRAECDTIQGYYYSKPINIDEYVRFINEHNKEEVEEQ
ncbi:MAG: EAL domain-containing protein [Bacilli bacterium]|nr:EAL domain-containing protein [Bacilli bacterium]